jgi:HlyD family type I secretion membrane fusion protein
MSGKSTRSRGHREWFADVPRRTRAPTLFGFSALATAVLGFGVWGNTAPIAGAVVASGVFVTTGQNKVIQHLEGGVIREILVREGDVVEPNQVLIQLDETAPNAELRRLVLRHARLMAIEARLQAEVREASEVIFPDILLAKADDPDIAGTLNSQRLTFEARRNSVENEVATLKTGIDALEERIVGGKIQVKAVEEQLDFIQEELEGKSHLLKTGLIRKPEVLALQRARANLKGEVGRIIGEIGDARERISRAKEQIAGVRKAAIKTAVEQLHEANAELNDVRERIRAARGVLERINITAPVRGVIVRLRYHTPGGVIEAGKNIMEIVPLKEELIIEAQVRPQDIDSVKRGQSAVVRLTALNQRLTQTVSGEVIYVSADAVADERRGQPTGAADVYVARIRLDAAEAAAVEGFQPTPGMPAEVYIKTVDRTFFEYLMQPIKDSMSRAFRET